MGTLIVFSFLAVFAIAIVVSGIKIIKQSESMVIERLGRYHRTLNSGFNVIIPILDKPREIAVRVSQVGMHGEMLTLFRYRDRIDLREAVYDFPKQNVITRDNVGTEINALIYFQVIDPLKAVYEIENLPQAIEKLTQTTLRNVIGELDLDETLTSRDTINSKLRIILDEATNKWGVKVNRVELQDINPPRDIREAMEKQMRAERDRRARILEAEGLKRAQILEAEGAKESDINRAEGQKQAEILRAEGSAQAKVRIAQAEAEAIEKIAQSIAKDNPVAATHYLIAQKYLETLQTMTEGDKAKTIYLPYEATGVLSSLGGIKDLLTNNQ
ncbi:MAG: SPFH/Band 7/PHB domain protein [Schleiferiaceae bacterium]|nr:SPFH/Band 7/PHB domain protein [Schleiferiaceae bacterium]